MSFYFIGSLILLAYLLGSIPTAVWVGRYFYGIDVREHGSGNAGSTNTIRVLGLKAGLPVLIIDMIKGFLAVSLVHLDPYIFKDTNEFVNYQLVFGGFAIIGHIFPLFAEFRGGKGVATLFGMIFAIHPPATLVAMGIFLVTLFISKYVSLSSMVAGLSFPILIIFVFQTNSSSMAIFSVVTFILLLITHQKNIERLFAGTESRADFLKKK